MSLVFVEGWELYEGTGSPPTAFTTKWGSYNKNWNLSVTTGRHFGYGMSFGKDWTGTADYAITPAQTPKATWIVGLNIRRGSINHNGPFLRAYSGGTIQLEFRLNGADIQVYRGGSTLIHTWSNALPVTAAENYATASTAYASKSLLVSGQENNPQGFAFKSDGTKVYVIGASNDTVYRYGLSTPWDISTATYDSVSQSISAQELTPTGIAFNSDGTKMYIIGVAGDDVTQYSLSVAWDITSLTLDGSYSVTDSDGGPTGIAFGNNGSKMYISGDNSNVIGQYALSTPWDVSTKVFEKNFSTTTNLSSSSIVEGVPNGLNFNSDGTKMYVAGDETNVVYEIELKTPWDIGAATQVNAFSVSGQEGGIQCIQFNNDGSKMYIIGNSGDRIYEYNMLNNTFNGLDWHHLQFKMTANTSTGSVECRYNNFDVSSDGTGLNTDQAASGSIDRFMLTGTTTAYRTTSWVVDDFWICNTDGARNNDWLGPLVVEGVYPDGNGYQNDWTPVVSDTTLSASAYTSGRFNSSDVYISNFINGNAFDPGAGPNSSTGHYITMFTWTNFLDAYDEFLSVGTFTLNYSMQVVRTEQMLVTVAAGNVSNPASGAAMQTLFGSKLTQTYTVTNPSLGLNTLDITAAITEWQAQGSLNNTWDLILMFSRTAGDTANNVMYFDKMNNFVPYITFSNATSDNVTAVTNPSTNDYVQAAVVGDIDSYTLGEPSNILGNVRAVVLNWQARKGGPSADIDVRSFVRSGTTNGYGVTKNISVPYPYQSYSDVYELNPESGGVPWAREHISNIEIGVELEG